VTCTQCLLHQEGDKSLPKAKNKHKVQRYISPFVPSTSENQETLSGFELVKFEGRFGKFL